jgi:hypothetical protein
MLTSDPAEALTVGKVDGLPEALASHEAVLADWLHQLVAGRDDEWRIARLLPVTLGISLTDGAARAVVNVVTTTGAEDLLRLVRMLWLCDGFTVTHPDLVVALLARGEEVLDGSALEEMKQLLVVAAVPRGGRWSPVAADETHIARLDHALQLTQDMSLPVSVRAIFSEGAAAIQAVMDEEARQWRDDEDLRGRLPTRSAQTHMPSVSAGNLLVQNDLPRAGYRRVAGWCPRAHGRGARLLA